ncbi:MAG: 5-formyltetrahydrofolate cyclo-ligase [Candidatus Saccharimonadales bacterium]|jgi:5-formyltetrahydrofolate cyclo-ligase
MSRDKTSLRQNLVSARLNMSAQEVQARSRAIANQLIRNVDWANIGRMHIYSSVTKWNEVQTDPIAEYVRRQWPTIKVIRPLIKAGQLLPNQKFDLIIVPCLGFDEELYRLGLGGGFYDRFLVNQPKALKIGLCFANGFIKDGLPDEPHDIPLDVIVTEEDIIKAHDS